MEYVIISGAALLVSALVLYSGFGLGSLLMPAFALFFPVPVAVASTAVVHLANNVFRIGFVGRHANWGIVFAFGIPAAALAIPGALLLAWTSTLSPLATYSLGERQFSITAVKIVVAALIGGFAVVELTPALSRWKVRRRYLPVGGALSGFFGGLSGHQGALRSAFLAQAGLTTQAFAGTTAIASFFVDLTRLIVYGASAVTASSSAVFREGDLRLVGVAVLAAFVGTFLSSRYLKQVQMATIRRLVGGLLTVLALALAAGIV